MPVRDEEAFLTVLNQLSKLLVQVDDKSFWREEIHRYSMQNGEEVIQSCKIIAAWGGGMGSFLDLVLTPVNGHKMADKDYLTLNQQLDDLREQLFKLANSIASRC